MPSFHDLAHVQLREKWEERDRDSKKAGAERK